MKRKLLIVALLATVLVFILALSASAVTGSTSNEYGTVTYVEGINEVKGYDTTSRVVLRNADGTYTTYLMYYICNGSTGTDMRLKFDTLNGKTGESYNAASVIRAEVFSGSRLNWFFENCSSLIDVYLPEGTYLHYASFTGCSSLTSIKLPSTGVTQIPTDCFSGCSSLESIEIPSTVKTLGARAFQNCYSLSVIKIPENVTDVIPQDFRKITNWNTPVTEVTYIVHKNCKGINSQYSLTNCSVKEIIFTGNADSAFVADVTSKASGWVSKITYANHCDVYYSGVHTESGTTAENPDTNLCYLVNCSVCGLSNTYVGNDKTHNMSTVYAYANYFANGAITSTCANEGCIYHTTPKVDNETLTPFFSELKYSTKEVGAAFGIYVEYKIDQDAIALYEVLSKKTVNYGVMAIMTSNITGNGPLNVDGTTSANYVVAADVTNDKLACTQLIITGNWAENAEIEITMLGFVTDGSELHYMGSQDGEATTGTAAGAFNAVTYKNITEEVA